MSDGTPNPATWPMCRGPFAYGHATATRIFCGFDTCERPLELGLDGTGRAASENHTSARRRHRERDRARDHEEHEQAIARPVAAHRLRTGRSDAHDRRP